jgi:hypothetical protein
MPTRPRSFQGHPTKLGGLIYEEIDVLTCSLSRSLWEIPTSAVYWPATTMPWFSATLLISPGTAESHLHSFQASSGTDLAAHLRACEGDLMHVLAGVPYHDGWDVRSVTEVLIGKLGDATVVVLRDSEGNEFCPDSPQIPVASLQEVSPVAAIAARKRPRRSKPLHSLGLTVHDQVAQARSAGPAMPGTDAPVRATQAVG